MTDELICLTDNELATRVADLFAFISPYFVSEVRGYAFNEAMVIDAIKGEFTPPANRIGWAPPEEWASFSRRYYPEEQKSTNGCRE